jgi:hypothetical protein
MHAVAWLHAVVDPMPCCMGRSDEAGLSCNAYLRQSAVNLVHGHVGAGQVHHRLHADLHEGRQHTPLHQQEAQSMRR